MAIRDIIILPDKKLRLVSKPVEKVTADVRRLAEDMFETMYEAPGVGLAAIQTAIALAVMFGVQLLAGRDALQLLVVRTIGAFAVGAGAAVLLQRYATGA